LPQGWKAYLATLIAGFLVAVMAFATPGHAETLEINIAYIRQQQDRPPVLSNLDPIPEDEGLAGAILGNADNAGTGKFLNHKYLLSVFELDQNGTLTAVSGPQDQPGDLILIDAAAAPILRFADRPENANRLIINMRSPADALRDTDCRANLLHTIPSYGMRADALAQFLLLRRWDDLVMIRGRHPNDRAFAAAIETSTRKFGLKIRATKDWIEDADLRRSASTEMPLFTQSLPAHDILIVADETDDFARYLPFNTWLPRPVAGSEGIRPTGWSPVVESWGAAQLQARFRDSAARPMRPVDYAAWAAVRTLGEAVTRTNTADAAILRDYILSGAFELAGFKGRALSFRTWNGQLRQTIHLVHPRAVVANAPLPGFLHQFTELDTLGLDAPETACRAFGTP